MAKNKLEEKAEYELFQENLGEILSGDMSVYIYKDKKDLDSKLKEMDTQITQIEEKIGKWNKFLKKTYFFYNININTQGRSNLL